jgi:hypothetical protein
VRPARYSVTVVISIETGAYGAMTLDDPYLSSIASDAAKLARTHVCFANRDIVPRDNASKRSASVKPHGGTANAQSICIPCMSHQLPGHVHARVLNVQSSVR